MRALSDARIAVTNELGALLTFLLLAGPLAWAHGPNGIAAATIAGNLAGLGICARHLARAHGIAVTAWLVPGPTMLGDGWSLIARLLSKTASASSR
jgi:O-antigen/teichoic acid export membrane protein